MMFKQFLFALLVSISTTAFAQLEDDNRVLNEFIIMMRPAQNVADIVKAYPEVQIKKCLSKQMNIWLLQRKPTADAENFLQILHNN